METRRSAQASEISHQETKASLGFWIYLMTDCVLFASLFATYSVLRNNTFGGPAGRELFTMPYVLVETLILLVSSFTAGLGLLAARRKLLLMTQLLFAVTFLLGVAFLAMELTEFRHLYAEGNSWRRSGFLSAFFTLVGTHGLHILSGLLWMAVMIVNVSRQGMTQINIKRLGLLSMFWHFLDVIWIFIFTIVYLFGVIRP